MQGLVTEECSRVSMGANWTGNHSGLSELRTLSLVLDPKDRQTYTLEHLQGCIRAPTGE